MNFGNVQLAIQQAISQAFKTPDIIRMFAEKQPDHLRDRLSNLKRDVTVKKISQQHYEEQAYEILIALKN
eukprot:UN06028